MNHSLSVKFVKVSSPIGRTIFRGNLVHTVMYGNITMLCYCIGLQREVQGLPVGVVHQIG